MIVHGAAGSLVRVRVDLPSLDRAVEAMVAESLQPGSEPSVIRRFLGAGASVDRLLEDLADVNAATAKGEAERIYAHLRRLRLGHLGLAALGTAGALFLLLQGAGALLNKNVTR
jgi:hypothetical protein